jgi:hypothetical protein
MHGHFLGRAFGFGCRSNFGADQVTLWDSDIHISCTDAYRVHSEGNTQQAAKYSSEQVKSHERN